MWVIKAKWPWPRLLSVIKGHFRYMTVEVNLSTLVNIENKLDPPHTDFELTKFGIYEWFFIFINKLPWARLIRKNTLNNLWLAMILAWQSNIAVCFYEWDVVPDSFKGAVSRGFFCFRSILGKNHYFEALLINNMLL